jgi:hypothetical protein
MCESKPHVFETKSTIVDTPDITDASGTHCGVLRREVRPIVGVEGADVVGVIHVSGWMYVSIGVVSSFGVCAYEREGERAR